jgi:osomolarity two-component system response regulator SKN7
MIYSWRLEPETKSNPLIGVAPGTAVVVAPPTWAVRPSTFVPGWAVPPRVLLVDDDTIMQRLVKGLLQVYGCTTDVAMDGEDAVTKMNVERYDLVLMDIVMPKLDGVSATHMIRQFDARTPIISMTSASKPVDLIKYFQNGMNDILPKPFSKEGLFEILEVRLCFFSSLSATRVLTLIHRNTSHISRPSGK